MDDNYRRKCVAIYRIFQTEGWRSIEEVMEQMIEGSVKQLRSTKFDKLEEVTSLQSRIDTLSTLRGRVKELAGKGHKYIEEDSIND